MSRSLLFKNIRHLVTCDKENRIYENVDLLARDGVIEAIGSQLDARADVVVDASDLAVYPGLINTHHHLYQILTRNIGHVQNLELFDWLKALYKIWKNLTAAGIHDSSLAGMAELAKYGCTTVTDHHYVFPKESDEFLAAQFAAAETLGVRLVATRGSMDLSEKDGGLPPDSVVQTIDEILRSSEKAVSDFHQREAFAMRQVVLAPCSPFSVSADLMRESAVLARSLKVRLHTHLCETKDEERYLQEKLGVRPLKYMEQLGWTGPDVWYAHGIHFNTEELNQLAEWGTGVAHCPISNMKLSSGVCRVPEMLELGVPLGLAVDGSASNDGSSLLEELRVGYLLHRFKWGAQAPGGYEMLKIACRGGARLIGRPELGHLAPGMAADFFALGENRLELAGAADDMGGILCTVGVKAPVDYTVVAGRIVVEKGEIRTLDEEKLSRRVAAHARKMRA